MHSRLWRRLRSGKDVYCEKPVTHYFAEGQAVVAEAAKQKAIFQTGSQQRSDKVFHQGVELVLNGVLGKIREVKVGLPKGHATTQGSDEEKGSAGQPGLRKVDRPSQNDCRT